METIFGDKISVPPDIGDYSNSGNVEDDEMKNYNENIEATVTAGSDDSHGSIKPKKKVAKDKMLSSLEIRSKRLQRHFQHVAQKNALRAKIQEAAQLKESDLTSNSNDNPVVDSLDSEMQASIDDLGMDKLDVNPKINNQKVQLETNVSPSLFPCGPIWLNRDVDQGKDRIPIFSRSAMTGDANIIANQIPVHEKMNEDVSIVDTVSRDDVQGIYRSSAFSSKGVIGEPILHSSPNSIANQYSDSEKKHVDSPIVDTVMNEDVPIVDTVSRDVVQGIYRSSALSSKGVIGEPILHSSPNSVANQYSDSEKKHVDSPIVDTVMMNAVDDIPVFPSAIIDNPSDQIQGKTPLSFAQIVDSKRKTVDCRIKIIAKDPNIKHGEVEMPVMNLISDKKLASPTVKYFVNCMWKQFGIEDLMVNEQGYYFFRFSSEQGMIDVMDNGPWLINNVPIFVQKWKPGLVLSKPEMDTVLVWVKVYNVPLEYWNETGIAHIANELGRPIMMDKVAEIAWLSSLNVNSIDLESGEKIVSTCNVEYALVPSRCSNCKIFGHDDRRCSILIAKSNQPAKSGSENMIKKIFKVTNKDGFCNTP
ncbi:hypothetical protein LXL04_037145 [Taraxacum kok-saghyz]